MDIDISDLPPPPKSGSIDISDLPPPPVQKPTEKSFGQKAIEFLEPTAEALGTAGGALIGGTAGTFGAGPVGTAVVGAAGAGLGYGAAKEIVQNIKEKLGYAPVRTGKQLISQPIENVATGATYELGGQALPSILQGAGKLGASIGNLLTKTPETRAAKIVSESLGPNLAQAREVLKSASSDLTASQALGQLDQAGQPILTIPTTQALLKRAEARDPEFFVKMFGEQEAKRFKELEKIAGGANQTEAQLTQAISELAIRKKPGRTEFQRAILGRGTDGKPTVKLTGSQGAGILRSMSEANCFVILHHDQGNVAPGDWVDVALFEGLL